MLMDSALPSLMEGSEHHLQSLGCTLASLLRFAPGRFRINASLRSAAPSSQHLLEAVLAVFVGLLQVILFLVEIREFSFELLAFI